MLRVQMYPPDLKLNHPISSLSELTIPIQSNYFQTYYFGFVRFHGLGFQTYHWGREEKEQCSINGGRCRLKSTTSKSMSQFPVACIARFLNSDKYTERGSVSAPINLATILEYLAAKVLLLGQPREEVSLELILRVVAEVGLVGLPNAGKSTLLGVITLAKPDIADYPFTILMPNLGRLDGDPSLGAGRYSSEATLADLPDLIEGAHLGKGLGQNFLRHLRRIRLLVHVVDAASEI